MIHSECEYVEMRRVTYDGGATFVPVCMKCHRFVRADKSVFYGDAGLSSRPNATCSKCGRTQMHFEGFIESFAPTERAEPDA